MRELTLALALQRLGFMNRQVKHHTARTAIAGRLRRLGLDVTEAKCNGKYDLLVNGHVRVALRVAFPGRYAHTVTVNGRRYAYDYRSWNFNFHRHGRWERRYCDVFVCVAKQRRAADEVFIIPAAMVTGPTFSLHGAGKPYRGRYATYRNRWSVFGNQQQQAEAASQVA
jgi:hypothetical protein